MGGLDLALYLAVRRVNPSAQYLAGLYLLHLRDFIIAVLFKTPIQKLRLTSDSKSTLNEYTPFNENNSSINPMRIYFYLHFIQPLALCHIQ